MCKAKNEIRDCSIVQSSVDDDLLFEIFLLFLKSQYIFLDGHSYKVIHVDLILLYSVHKEMQKVYFLT